MSELNIISSNGLLRLQLNRPKVLNALSPTLLNAIIDACNDIGQDESIRVVVLEGAGEHFSAGADLPAFHKDLVSDPLPTADLGRRATEAIAALPQIAIAVESRCGAVALGSTLSVAAPFVWRCPSSRSITPFPHPAHRTGHADFPHPALGQDITFSPTTHYDLAASDVRDHSTRRDATEDKPHLDVA